MALYGQKQFHIVNHSVPREDGFDKVTGRATYAADIKYPNMIYAAMLRLVGVASAKVTKIDTSKALKLAGVLAVFTADSFPKMKSWARYFYITDTVRYVGDVIAIIAAETYAIAEEAKKLIHVTYEELPAVFDIREAMKEGAHPVHEEYPDNIFTDSIYTLRKGDTEKGFEQADLIIERTYETQYAEHAYIEPEAVVASEDSSNGEMTIHASAQNPFFTRRYVADILQIPLNRVHIIQETLGGSFGGKEEGVGLLAARAAFVCHVLHRPVKMVYTREESILESSKRHPFLLTYRAGVKKDGRIVAWEATQIGNSGAYNNQTQFLNWRACAHCAGAYDIPNIKSKTFGVFTNNVHSGAFRGYSSPQLLFAQEQFIEEIAEELGMEPLKLRLINCLRDGSTVATGAKVSEVLLPDIIEYTAKQTDYTKKYEQNKTQSGRIRKGIGMAISHRGCGYGAESPDAAGAFLIVNEDASVLLHSGIAENGQGLKTVYCQIAAEALGVPYENIRFFGTDTHRIPDCGMTVASRGTVMGSQAVKKAGEKLNLILREHACTLGFFDSGKGGAPNDRIAQDLVLREGHIFDPSYHEYQVPLADVTNIALWKGLNMAAYEWHVPDPCIQEHDTQQGRAFPTYSYTCVVAELEVDTGTGEVTLKNVHSSHDVGTAINPALIKGQIYGGIVMGWGYASMEEVVLKNGIVGSRNLDEYLIPTAMDMPNMKVSIFECDDNSGTYGAKSVGEPAIECVAAAIANALYNATGRRIRCNPAGLENVLIGRKLW
ncbi:MAG: xanthine dehydrogenase family protein molybdopterin-binding subunit [Lachnospiraceae bacterium]|jgi:CO/xanthine dehydrogenase Mo-binding subunit|nr:xanthine dehydrogenase family protein molybdopterin-binding subunit [Lachnospiraceae bacterium]